MIKIPKAEEKVHAKAKLAAEAAGMTLKGYVTKLVDQGLVK